MATQRVDSASSAPAAHEGLVQRIAQVIFGGLIGLAEMVPGVSGGTIALVVGIYERAIRNGDALIHLARTALTRRSELKASAAKVEWSFLIAVGLGMVVTVLGLSGVMHAFVEHHAETARGLFLGMVAVSIWVPLRMISSEAFDRQRVPAIALFVIAAVATFFLTGLTSAEKSDPSLVVVFFAAMIAVCALVLPGVSGSFLLLALGLYAPIIGAVSDRNLTVMGVFALGALTGIALFIRVLDYLLTTHHTLTLATMAGLMLGSLRALWPWQDDQANLLAPHGSVVVPLCMIVLGAVIIVAVMLLERVTSASGKKSASRS